MQKGCGLCVLYNVPHCPEIFLRLAGNLVATEPIL